jgi:non-specific serine/threonine protein kinase
VLAGFLAERRLLLIIDNCEHLVPIVALLVATLLPVAAGLRVLVTSREPLDIIGEHVYRVAPLPAPAPDTVVAADAGTRYPALVLFAERAVTVSPGFAITGENVGLVARVCQRLDGIPLAIELAAARLRTLALADLVSGLDHRFRVLTGGDGDMAPVRHQTLRAAVEWSFDLCAKPERLLWLRASVFAGGFDLEAAEWVFPREVFPDGDVREIVLGLVDKSVVIAEDHAGGRRYRMLDTISEYGLDRIRHPHLDDQWVIDEVALRRQHRDYYLDLAERLNADWFGPRQLDWSRRMRPELPNLREALGFCLDHPGGAGVGLQLAGALLYFWWAGGDLREGAAWLRRVLAADPHPSVDRVRALCAYSMMLCIPGDYASAPEPAREAIELARRLHDRLHLPLALACLGLSLSYSGQVAAGLPVLEEAVARARDLGQTHPMVAYTLNWLGVGARLQGDPVRAGELGLQARAICRVHGDQWFLSICLLMPLMTALTLGDLDRARRYGQESLRAGRAVNARHLTAVTIEFIGWVEGAAHDHRRAARLYGAADRRWRDIGVALAGHWAQQQRDHRTPVRQALGETTFDAEYRRGGALDLDDAVDYALGEQAPATAPPPTKAPAAGEPVRLTRRETDVAALVARGLTNRQIAERLMIGQRTVETHVANIFTKLGVTSRTRIATWYAEQAGPTD